MLPWVHSPNSCNSYGGSGGGLSPLNQAKRAMLLQQLSNSQPRFPSELSRLRLAQLEAQMARKALMVRLRAQQLHSPHPSTTMYGGHANLPRLISPADSVPSPSQGLELLRSVSLGMDSRNNNNNLSNMTQGMAQDRRNLLSMLPPAPLVQGQGLVQQHQQSQHHHLHQTMQLQQQQQQHISGFNPGTPDRSGSPMSLHSTHSNNNNSTTTTTNGTTPGTPTTSSITTIGNRVYINDIQDWDVLCGRGGRSNHHPGNKRYRHVVSEMKLMYRNTEAKAIKTDLSRAIVEHVCNYGGRFVKKDDDSDRYFVLTKAEARKKTSQALRETKELKWTI